MAQLKHKLKREKNQTAKHNDTTTTQIEHRALKKGIT